MEESLGARKVSYFGMARLFIPTCRIWTVLDWDLVRYEIEYWDGMSTSSGRRLIFGCEYVGR